ncbi:MAG: PLP-dependent aminotransferase family protein [Desulfobacteraceae bacterium]|nr:MAG: PLP-dependent aminotransferase family protein [Desulfobacteraceae bacterium]
MNSKAPLYQVIADTIKERIAAGIYKPGEKIPPIRCLTESFGVNKATVHKAFGCLKSEGLIENRVGSGSYVRFPEKIQTTPHLFDFRTDYLNEHFFPYRQAQSIFNELFEKEKAHALAPTPVEGDPELLRVLSGRYHLPVERMLIISGAQQGLDLVSKVFAAKISESILFENPTYPGAISLFRARHFVPLEEDGPDLTELDQRLTGPVRLFYTMPSVHNPTGISYSNAKKEALARRAREHSFYIIEDDYLGELKPPELRLVDIEPRHTIHIKSFAQTTLAGIRLGLMVVPEALYAQFLFAKFSSDITSSGLLQKFLREFLKNGLYARHIETLRRKTLNRRRRLQSLIEQFPFLSATPEQFGYSLWLKTSIALNLPHELWCRGEEFSFDPAYKPFIRLTFMHMDDATFIQALDYLHALLVRCGTPHPL